MSRPAPYPATTKAKGWRFELDIEQVTQSDTWALAPAELRPWLLMVWTVAWQQVPCGSLPAEDELIAARLGMPLEVFAAAKPKLLRGWWAADDGRLYQTTIVNRVLDMLGRKEAERKRKADWRAKQSGETHGSSDVAPELSRGTDAGLTPESQGIDATGTGTGTSSSSSLRSEESSAPAKPAKPAKAAGYSEAFEGAWREYPDRPGQSKAEAFKAWNARLASGVTAEILTDGVRRYAAYCAAERTEPRFVKHAATFFGPDRHYESDWTPRLQLSPHTSQAPPGNRQEALEQRNREAASKWAANKQRELEAADAAK